MLLIAVVKYLNSHFLIHMRYAQFSESIHIHLLLPQFAQWTISLALALFFHLRFNVIFVLCDECFSCIYFCAPCVCSAHGNQKKVLDPLQMES